MRTKRYSHFYHLNRKPLSQLKKMCVGYTLEIGFRVYEVCEHACFKDTWCRQITSNQRSRHRMMWTVLAFNKRFRFINSRTDIAFNSPSAILSILNMWRGTKWSGGRCERCGGARHLDPSTCDPLDLRAESTFPGPRPWFIKAYGRAGLPGHPISKWVMIPIA